MEYNNAYLRGLFKEFNEAYFEGKIPKCKIDFSDLTEPLGNYRSEHMRIASSPVCVGAPEWEEWFLRETVLHEMIHAYIHLVGDGVKRNVHGKEFHTVVKEIRKKYGARTFVNPYSALHRRSLNPFVRLRDIMACLLLRYLL